MTPDPVQLIKALGLQIPPIGLYDAPDPAAFAPLVEPPAGARACVFAYYQRWLSGETLLLRLDRTGCRGARTWLFGAPALDRDAFVRFLVDDEGLKASHELMHQWLDHTQPYHPQHEHILIGPLRPGHEATLKTITLLVNPDQLSLLCVCAQYHRSPADPPPVIAPFGSGCGQFIALFPDLNAPQAIIGSTDIAMRQYLPPDRLAFTVTPPLWAELCALDERSPLHRPFWQRLQKARKSSSRQQPGP